ncbi:MAG: hypothetical protein Q8P20_07600 [bacterium]|nr:hypothetical protein [bacterium]
MSRRPEDIKQKKLEPHKNKICDSCGAYKTPDLQSTCCFECPEKILEIKATKKVG